MAARMTIASPLRPSAARRVAVAAWIVVFAASAVIATVAPALAQTDSTLSLGGGVAHYHPTDDSAHDSTGFALVYRFGRSEGWRPAIGFNWFTTRFDAQVGSTKAELGDLRVRPIMGGYGYTVRRGPVSVTGSAIGGVAFNSFEASTSARIAYADSLNRVLLDVKASNSLVARTEVVTWYDLNSRFGLMAVVGYIAARPNVTIITDAGSEKRRLTADSLKFQVGVGYSIF
jgi:hypothetical protein